MLTLKGISGLLEIMNSRYTCVQDVEQVLGVFETPKQWIARIICNNHL